MEDLMKNNKIFQGKELQNCYLFNGKSPLVNRGLTATSNIWYASIPLHIVSGEQHTHQQFIHSLLDHRNSFQKYINCNEFFRLHSCLLFKVGDKSKCLLRSRRSTRFLGSVLPDSVSDALDPAHHHVLQNVVSSGLRSYAVVRKVDKLEGTSSPTQFTSLSLIIFPVSRPFQGNGINDTYSGYCEEYTLSINNKNESLWTLEREFNLCSITNM
ncbi:unnamed protein product [Arabis nemorensis]|uniref:Uncharacterized protein n=1 Tax=Arabis nemorensis TaxID=586526 RepID=A0A565CBB0_9BRAS|nr:unnamed protein product [Arabis nemorensis]